jgi:phthiocerol/phenolphthiocerol synthesis type-I polyketide synthase E
VQFDLDTALAVRETVPGLGHAVELRVYRSAGVLHLDWWYDTRRVESAVAASWANSFSTALMDLVREAVGEDDSEAASDEIALVDLS